MNNYMPVTYSSLIENTIVGCDLYISTYVNGMHRYVLYSHGDEIFTSERKMELLRQNINKLFVFTKDIKSYIKYQENNLHSILEDKNKTSKEKSYVVYDVAKYIVRDLLDDPRAGINIVRVAKWLDNTISYILQDENAFSSLLRVTSYDYFTYTHSINLSVIGLLFGKYLSMDVHNLDCLGTGMLLHDLGKVKVPIKILKKPGKLTKEEFDIVKKHPEAGLKLLEGQKQIEEKSLSVIIQHHENYDGTGYPYRIGGDDIHLFGKISRIIDAYDATTTNRPYGNARRPFTALANMKEMMFKSFDKKLYREFVYFLGPADSRKRSRNSDILINNPDIFDMSRKIDLSNVA